MKYLGPLLAGGLTLVIVLIIGVFSFWPAEQAVTADPPPTQQIVVSIVETTELEAAMAEREAVYQAQIEELSRALQERQATYQTQIQELTTQIAAAQNQLNELKIQEQNLPSQITQLEVTRAERLAVYQSQLQQVQEQYNNRLTQLQVQLNEAQARLAEANAQLGQ